MSFISVPGRKPRVSDHLLFDEDDEVEVAQTPPSDFDPLSMMDSFKKHEKPVPYMYRDSEGYVTAGVGHMIPSRDHAAELPFQYEDPLTKERRPATRDEIQRGYDQLPGQKGQKNNFSATSYKPETRKLMPLYLNNDEIDDVLKKDIQLHYDGVRRQFDDYDTYPIPVRRALLDMQFNMGSIRFNAQTWPKFFSAVRNQQWSKAGDESHRTNVSDTRNESTKNLFYDAWRKNMGYGPTNRR